MSRRLFPVQDSTLSAESLAESVLKKYSLPGPVECRFFRKGICDTYRVTAGEQEYYLKVYRYARRTRMDVTEEVRLLNYLSAHGISVAKAVARRDGIYVSRLAAPEGTRTQSYSKRHAVMQAMTGTTVGLRRLAKWWAACISAPTRYTLLTGEAT